MERINEKKLVFRQIKELTVIYRDEVVNDEQLAQRFNLHGGTYTKEFPADDDWQDLARVRMQAIAQQVSMGIVSSFNVVYYEA